MKKLQILLICAVVATSTIHAQTFAKQIGGAAIDQGRGIVIDASGNVYATGYFNGTVDFDPGAGVVNLTSAGGDDIFVTKVDVSGSFVWARRMGGAGSDQGLSIALDASNNVYTTGIYNGAVDFDPGAGVTTLTSVGSTDVFVSKLTTAGAFTWARSMGGASADIGQAILTDLASNVYIAINFQGTIDVNPGAGVVNLVSAGSTDMTLVSLSSAGVYGGSKLVGGTGADIITSAKIDGSGNYYITGHFSGTVDFDPNAGIFNLISAGNTDIYVMKGDITGNLTWVKRIGSTTADQSSTMIVDASGNVYTTGSFTGTADFDPNAGTSNLTAAGGTDIYVLKLNSAGNYVWAQQFGAAGADLATALNVDASGNVYSTGSFTGTVDFDPSAGVLNKTSVGGIDMFFSKLNSAGNFVWAQSIGGTGADQANSIAVDAAGNVHTTGFFQNTADFEPAAPIVNLVSSGNDDIFLSKLNSLGVLPVYLNAFSVSFTTEGNYLQWQTANEINTEKFIVERSINGRDFTTVSSVAAARNGTYHYTDATPFKETVYYRLKITHNDGSFNYSNIAKLNATAKATLSLYPNPAVTTVSLQLADKTLLNTTATILDMQGKKQKQFLVANNGQQVDVASLAKGTYLLQLANGDNLKFIKN